MKALLLLFLAFSLTTCSKFGRTVTLKGRVVNPITGQGYEGAEIHIKRSEMFKLPGGNKIVKTKTSDSEGYFEISKSGFNHYFADAWVSEDYYMLGWFKDGEYIGGNTIALKVGKKINADFHIVPYGELKLNIQNVNCEGPNDVMVFRSKGQFDDDYAGYSTERLGCYSYLSPNSSLVPTGYRYYEIKVTRSTVVSYFYDTVFVSGNGVSTVDLLY